MVINWIEEGFDILVSLSGKYGRWLNIKKKRACFYIWSCCATYWMVRDFQIGLYSQGIFCIISIGFHLYGAYNWGKDKG